MNKIKKHPDYYCNVTHAGFARGRKDAECERDRERERERWRERTT